MTSAFASGLLACGTNDIHGIVEVHRGILLTATTNAPAGAAGKAQFDGACDHGTNAATLVIITAGLSNGTYSVSVTDLSGTNTYDLGSFDVPSASGDDEAEDHHGGCGFHHGFDYGSWTNWICHSGLTNVFDGGLWTNCAASWTNWLSAGLTNLPPHGCHDHQEVDNDNGAAFVLPDGVSPTDLASLAIADVNRNVVLTGDFTTLTNTVTGRFDADCDVVAGTNAPSVAGHASVIVQVKNGKSHGKFLLIAHGVPARQKLTIQVNGAASGTARADKNGNVTIKNIHQKNLMAVKSVVATDKNKNVIFSVQF
jgi:hypothetical protein